MSDQAVAVQVLDLHCHSRYSDGTATVAELLARAGELGIGLAVTDHNEIRGSLEACAAGGVCVIPAVEITSVEGRDLIVYFDRPDELEAFYRRAVEPYRSPNMCSRTVRPLASLVAAATEAPCRVCLPHPFGPMWKSIGPVLEVYPDLPGRVDLIEVANASCNATANGEAWALAQRVGKPGSGGSDAHVLEGLGAALTLVPGRSPAECLEALATGRAMVYGGRMRPEVRLFSNVSMVRRQIHGWLVLARRRVHARLSRLASSRDVESAAG